MKLVAFSASRPDDRFLSGAIDFTPKALHVYVDDVGQWIVPLVPHVFRDVAATDHRACMLREILEQRILARRESHRPASAMDLPGGGVDPEIAHRNQFRQR